MMCNTIGCPNLDNPPLCADCADAVKEWYDNYVAEFIKENTEQ